jgi:hypothetical protein
MNQFMQQHSSPKSNCTCSSSSNSSSYGDNYLNFVSNNVIDPGAAAALLLGGVMPKSWAPATGFRGPMLGSTNPLTSVPRGVGVPGAGGPVPRAASAAIALATMFVGMYDATIELEGFLYAIPDSPCQ